MHFRMDTAAIQVFILLLCLVLPVASAAQPIPPSAVEEIKSAVQSGAVTPSEVKAAKQKLGIGNLTPQEIEQGRKILEGRGKARENVSHAGGKKAGQQPGQQARKKKKKKEENKGKITWHPPKMPPDMATLLSMHPKERPVPKLPYFGYDLFQSPPSTFAPITNVPVPGNYLLGPGDELVVFLWGRLDETMHLVVDRNGMLDVPHVGPVPVLGLSFDDARKVLRHKLEAMTGVNARVSMGSLRSIRVFVLGEVRNPGLYTVSALSTLTNALLASGGPTRLGTLRRVELKRNNKVISSVDFYEFLLKGKVSGDKKLLPGDVIFVPKSGPRVTVYGNVRRPAVYELSDRRDLGTVFDLAAGIRPTAYAQRIQVERNYRHQKKIVLDLKGGDWSKYRTFPIEDGDVIKVFSIVPTSVNAVFLYGNVIRPGSYAWHQGMRLHELIPNINALATDAALDYGLVKRYHLKTMSTELIPFRPSGLLHGDKRDDLALKPLDEVYIFNRWYFESPPRVTVQGEVREPGTYRIDDTTHLKDVIHLAGGLTRNAYLRLAHIYRIDPKTHKERIIFVNLGKALRGDPKENLLMQARDRVVVHSIQEMVPYQTVSISGEVNRPGTYTYAANMTLRDLLIIAGNVKETAYLEQGELMRFQLTPGHVVKTRLLTFNVRKALKGEQGANLLLNPYDSVFIKKIPGWRETWHVKVQGEVKFPGPYTISKGERLSSLIERCGGFTDEAYLRGIVFTRKSVRKLQEKRIRELTDRMQIELARLSNQEIQGTLSKAEAEQSRFTISSLNRLVKKLSQAKPSGRIVLRIRDIKSLKGSSQDIILEDGDGLVVPRIPQTVLVIGQVYNPNAILYDPDHAKAGHYIDLAGGLTNRANKKELYIVRADGSVRSSNSGSMFSWSRENFRFQFGEGIRSVKLYPGDTIIVPERLKYPNYMKDLKDITEMLYNTAIAVGVWHTI